MAYNLSIAAFTKNRETSSIYDEDHHHGEIPMLTLFTALALAGGALRLVLQWQLKKRWGISLGIPQALAGALLVLAGLPDIIRPFPFPVPLGLTIGLLLPDLLLRKDLG